MDIRVGPDPAVRAATWIARRLRAATRRRGSAALAVSGGGTALPMIDALSELDLPWSQIGVWQVDERIVPDGHEARNALQLQSLSALPCRISLMPVTANDLRRAARRYAASLPDRFDIVHLGLGTDGHTASWPPGIGAIAASSRPVEITDEFNSWRRMTLTRAVVNDARSRVVLAVGASKQAIVERWLLGDRSLPITAVRRSDTWLFIDEDAAPRVTLHTPRSGRHTPHGQ
jgi:6-phosphogluconolactonase/glucosamine-6-phosphate isomerase/deaminase